MTLWSNFSPIPDLYASPCHIYHIISYHQESRIKNQESRMMSILNVIRSWCHCNLSLFFSDNLIYSWCYFCLILPHSFLSEYNSQTAFRLVSYHPWFFASIISFPDYHSYNTWITCAPHISRFQKQTDRVARGDQSNLVGDTKRQYWGLWWLTSLHQCDEMYGDRKLDGWDTHQFSSKFLISDFSVLIVFPLALKNNSHCLWLADIVARTVILPFSPSLMWMMISSASVSHHIKTLLG
jgi:hypothetical protein